MLPAIPQSLLVGPAWFTVSTFLTTYSTNAFLLYKRPPLKSLSPPAQIVDITSTSLLLTLWRFGFSQLASLVVYLVWNPFGASNSMSGGPFNSIISLSRR